MLRMIMEKIALERDMIKVYADLYTATLRLFGSPTDKDRKLAERHKRIEDLFAQADEVGGGCRADHPSRGARQNLPGKARIRAGDQWDVADLIAPELLVKAGLATTPVDFSSTSLQGPLEPPPPSAPSQNDPSSSDESDVDSNDDSDADSDASGSEDDSDDSSSSSESSPLQTRPRRSAHAPLSEGADSSLSLPLHSSSITDHDAEPFVRVEDPAEGEYYVDIMSDLDDPLAPDSEEA
ncbi:hypothetical protein Dimus_020864 [Dionaea muscipula]